MKITPISKVDMAEQRKLLDEKYRKELAENLKAKVSGRYTMEDMSALTGWSKEYLLRMEQEREIPKANRHGPHGKHQWNENQARMILGFRRTQEQKFPRFYVSRLKPT